MWQDYCEHHYCLSCVHMPKGQFLLKCRFIRYLVTFVVYLKTHLPHRHCNCQCPCWHSSCCRLATITGSSKENVAATSRRELRDICWSRSDHKPRSLVLETAMTLSWSSAAVSEWVIVLFPWRFVLNSTGTRELENFTLHITRHKKHTSCSISKSDNAFLRKSFTDITVTQDRQ